MTYTFLKKVCVAVLSMVRDLEHRSFKEKITTAAGMPKDVVQGAAVVTLTGNEEVCIENYRRIIEYTDDTIRVQAKKRQIRISGKQLKIEYYTNDEMKITGKIDSLEYCK